MIHIHELDFSGRQVHNYRPEILIHIHELDFSGRQVHNYRPGASLERVPRVPRHPLRFGNGCLAPVLIIDLGIEHPKIRLRRPDFEVKEKILLPNRLEK